MGLGGVENTIRARESLDETVVLKVLVNVERVQIFRVEAGEEHVHNDGNIDFLGAFARQIGVGELLVFNPLLDVLIIKIKLADGMIGAIAGVVVSDDDL